MNTKLDQQPLESLKHPGAVGGVKHSAEVQRTASHFSIGGEQGEQGEASSSVFTLSSSLGGVGSY